MSRCHGLGGCAGALVLSQAASSRGRLPASPTEHSLAVRWMLAGWLGVLAFWLEVEGAPQLATIAQHCRLCSAYSR